LVSAQPNVNDEDDESLLSVYDEDILSEMDQIQALLDHEEDLTLSRTKVQEQEILNLTCATLTLTTDEMMNVCVLDPIDIIFYLLKNRLSAKLIRLIIFSSNSTILLWIFGSTFLIK